MFEHTSRYYSLEDAKMKGPDGRMITYKRRRFLPQGLDMQILTEISITEGDRLDTITARILDDPEQFWRICDANNAMEPTELVEQVGKKLRVPIPQFTG